MRDGLAQSIPPAHPEYVILAPEKLDHLLIWDIGLKRAQHLLIMNLHSENAIGRGAPRLHQAHEFNWGKRLIASLYLSQAEKPQVKKLEGIARLSRFEKHSCQQRAARALTRENAIAGSHRGVPGEIPIGIHLQQIFGREKFQHWCRTL